MSCQLVEPCAPIDLPLRSLTSLTGLSSSTERRVSITPFIITARTGILVTTLACTMTLELISPSWALPPIICCTTCSEAPTGWTWTS